MDCVLLLRQLKLESMQIDAEGRACPRPSWNESLKVGLKLIFIEKLDLKNNFFCLNIKLMANLNFLPALLEFKRDLINEETVELMEPYIRMEDYNLETAKRVCGNVAGLLSWTVAMTEFFEVNKEVLPLKDNLKVQEVKLKAAMEELNKAQSQLDEKERETQEALREYNIAMQDKQRLEDDAERKLIYFLPIDLRLEILLSSLYIQFVRRK